MLDRCRRVDIASAKGADLLMTWWSWVLGLIAVAFIVVGFGMLVRAGWQIFGHVRLGASDPFRAGPIGRRLATLVKELVPLTIRLLSPLNDTLVTTPVCPLRVRASLAVAASHTFTI